MLKTNFLFVFFLSFPLLQQDSVRKIRRLKNTEEKNRTLFETPSRRTIDFIVSIQLGSTPLTILFSQLPSFPMPLAFFYPIFVIEIPRSQWCSHIISHLSFTDGSSLKSLSGTIVLRIINFKSLF
jgi:hypothetical protein